jgi:penicillin-binding protein 1A
MSSKSPSSENKTTKNTAPPTSALNWLLRFALWTGAMALAGLFSILIVIAIALAVAFPNLPDISDLQDYRPKLPLRVFSYEGALIGEFGEERRHLTPVKEIPKGND